jgi:hypothetical protein
MEIHKPHAAKTWREFFVELGTIVAGVLIALGLEQAVEAVHRSAQASEAREAIDAEVVTDLTRARQRDFNAGCVNTRLAELDRIVDAAGPDGRIRTPSWVGRPPRYGIETARWDAASASGRVSLLSADWQSKFGIIYAGMRYHYEENLAEQEVWSRLDALTGVDRLTPDGKLKVKADIAQARFLNWSLHQGDTLIARRAADIGLHATARHDPPFTVCWPIDTPRAQAMAKEWDWLDPQQATRPR